jgi:hypothetical protein
MLLLAGFVAGCAPRPEPGEWVAVREVTPSFLAHGRTTDASLATDGHGRVALTFVTRDTMGKDLWLSVSRDSGLSFSDPVRVNPRPGSVASFPEGRPIAAFGPGGAIALAWADRRPDTSGAVDLVVRASGDGGATLSPAVVINDEAQRLANARGGGRWRILNGWNLSAYHGFPALTFRPDGSLFAAWLDERGNAPTTGEPSVSSLYCATSSDGGQTWSPNAQVADSVCPCCRPMAMSDLGGRVAIAYRDGRNDIRDPALAISPDGGSTFTLNRVISADGWHLTACPDQGASFTWNRDVGGYYAWYTGAEVPGVYLMPWRPDFGAGGVKRSLDDSLHEARSPRLAAMGGTTLIAVEARARADTTHTVLAVRALDANGTLTRWCFLGAEVSSGAICALDRRAALASWTEHEGHETRVRVVRLRRHGV